MDERSTADVQILAILAELQRTLGEDFSKLEAHEIASIREIIAHSETLVRIAEYEEARRIVWETKRRVVLAAAAFVSALAVLVAYVEKLGIKLMGVLQ